MRKLIRGSLNNAAELCRASELLIPFVVPTSVGIVVQIQKRMLAAAPAIIRAAGTQAGCSRDVSIYYLESGLLGSIRVRGD